MSREIGPRIRRPEIARLNVRLPWDRKGRSGNRAAFFLIAGTSVRVASQFQVGQKRLFRSRQFNRARRYFAYCRHHLICSGLLDHVPVSWKATKPTL